MALYSIFAGVAQIDITPDRSLDLSGVPNRQSAGVLAPLEAQVVVLRNAATKHVAILATLDTLYVPGDWGDPLRQRIAEVAGIAGDAAFECVTLAASHTHSAPGLQTLRRWGVADMQYRKDVADRLVEAAVAAMADLQPASIRIGTAALADASCNRRTPGGPIDPVVTVVGLEDQQAKPLAVMVHFACHPVTFWGYKNLISPDFPGYVRRELNEFLGPGALSMYLNGAAGNLNPIEFDRTRVNEEYSRGIAAQIAHAALEAWRNASTLDTQPLRTGRIERTLIVDPVPTSEQLDKILRREKQFVRDHPEQIELEDRSLRTIGWAQDLQQVMSNGSLPEGDVLELQAIRLGDLLLLAVPGELYVEIGRQLKQLSPFRHTLIVGYANGMLGYLCTQDWQRQAGAQEKFISLRLQSLSVDTEKTIIDSASDLFEQMRR
jgi:neutral ceramidase